MIVCVPMELKEVINAAVPPARVVEEAPEGTTATGLPIGTPPLKKVTVPVVPVALLLVGDTMEAVSVTFVPAGTEEELEATPVLVAA